MLTRRSFLGRSLQLGAGTFLGAAGWAGARQASEPAAGSSSYPVRLGAPLFLDTKDPEALARAHRDQGYSAAYCPAVSLEDHGEIRGVVEAFARHDVVLAEVGRWVNLLDRDPDTRVANLRYVTDGLALAEAVGARCCVDIAGSYNEKEWYGPHPRNLSTDFFDAAVENARKIIDAVKPRRAKFCYEMMGWALPDSAESYQRMLRAVDRQAFGVHLDPCNLINSPARFYDTTAVLNDCFDKLGAAIVSCHAKDLTWDVEMNVHFREVRPGLGTLDYATYLRRLAALPQQPPLMLEHLVDAQAYTKGADYIREVGGQIGVAFA